GLSTLYNTAGMPQTRVVTIPAPGDPLNASGAPTGLVFNIAGGATGVFKVSGVTSGGLPTSAAATFLFASEDGAILGWSPTVNPVGFNPANAGNYAIVAKTVPDAIYKGLAIATDAGNAPHLYASNFSAGTVDVFDGSFTVMPFSDSAFVDR